MTDSDVRELAVALARIEGMLAAALPQHTARLDTHARQIELLADRAGMVDSLRERVTRLEKAIYPGIAIVLTGVGGAVLAAVLR